MKKRKQSLMWVSIFLLLGALTARGAYLLIGSSVDAQGRLQEPFGLIVISTLLLLSGVITGLIFLISLAMQTLRKKE